MFLFAFVFIAICRASENLDYSPYSQDLLFSLDQNIQDLSQPLYHRFEHPIVKDKARAGFIAQAWQDVMEPQTKVYFPEKFAKDKRWRWQQLAAWEDEHIYGWYQVKDGFFPKRMFFIGYSTLQPAHMRLHSIVVTPLQGTFEFANGEWCEKPFWSNTSTCKMKSKIHLKKPGFLVNRCIPLAYKEAMAIRARAARRSFENALIKGVSVLKRHS